MPTHSLHIQPLMCRVISLILHRPDDQDDHYAIHWVQTDVSGKLFLLLFVLVESQHKVTHHHPAEAPEEEEVPVIA